MGRWIILVIAFLSAVFANPPYGQNGYCEMKGGSLTISKTSFSLIFNKDVVSELCSENKNYKDASSVTFEYVMFKNIAKNTFEDFLQLEIIQIFESTIDDIEEDAFSTIKSIKFSNCIFKFPPPAISSISLEELIFENSGLNEIPILSKMPNLKLVSLPGNRIEKLSNENFKDLYYLEELNVENNSINEIPLNLFDNNKYLATLNLGHNPLTYFTLNSLPSLEKLSLAYCNLNTFDEKSSVCLKEVDQLDLSGNQLQYLPVDTFGNMKSLFKINLSNNKLSELDPKIFFNVTELEQVILDGNEFNSLPEFEFQIERAAISLFSCQNCSLSQLSKDVFKNMPKISALKLSKNNLNDVSELFTDMFGLKYLDLSYNHIEKISPSTFIHNKNIKIINLSGNPLKEISPKPFMENHVLKVLDMRKTRLSHIWVDYESTLLYVQKLLVSGNNIEHLRKEELSVTPKLKYIDVTNNPINADDSYCKLINWMKEQEIVPVKYTEQIGTGQLYDNAITEIKRPWADIFNIKCNNNLPVVSDEFDYTTEFDDTDDDSEFDDDYSDEEDEQDRISEVKITEKSNGFTIAIVFFVTAATVLLVGMLILLIVLRSNRFNSQRTTLPRIRFPTGFLEIWSSNQNQKKHSGSVYKILTEDRTGSTTPIVSRFVFPSRPIVHTSSSEKI